MGGRVVLINGPSSVGKSSVARALQSMRPEPWLIVAFDDFLGFAPQRLVNLDEAADDGFRWFPADLDDPEAVTRIAIGPWGHRLMRAMHRAVGALAAAGLDVIVDDVLLDPGWFTDYLEALREIDVVFVGLTAPLEVIEERELARGDRFPRQARGHYATVHREERYDLLIDTSVVAADEAAAAISARLDSGPGIVFDELRRTVRV